MAQATKTTDEGDEMNVKQMSDDELREQVELQNSCQPVNDAQRDFWKECRKELMKRWGIKG